jgi:hypothetical protein
MMLGDTFIMFLFMDDPLVMQQYSCHFAKCAHLPTTSLW